VPAEGVRSSTSNARLEKYVPVRQGSYGSHDATRKRGSDEGKSPKTELVGCYVWRVVFILGS
jgi:hypothetical protein